MGLAVISKSKDHSLREIKRVVTIGMSLPRVFRFCQDIQNLTTILGPHAEASLGKDGRTYWSGIFPRKKFVWKARKIEIPDQSITWISDEGSLRKVTLEFHHAASSWGTELTMKLSYLEPKGLFARGVGEIFKMAPEVFVFNILRRMKSYLETGHLTASRGALRLSSTN